MIKFQKINIKVMELYKIIIKIYNKLIYFITIKLYCIIIYQFHNYIIKS
jgi:hypothetical protein